MKLIISTKNITLDQPLKIFVETKIGSLGRFFKGKDNPEARVEIGLPSKHHRSGRIYYAEINLKIGGKLLRATCQHDDLRNAIVDAKDELQRQVKKFKSKKEDLIRKSGK